MDPLQYLDILLKLCVGLVPLYLLRKVVDLKDIEFTWSKMRFSVGGLAAYFVIELIVFGYFSRNFKKVTIIAPYETSDRKRIKNSQMCIVQNPRLSKVVSGERRRIELTFLVTGSDYNVRQTMISKHYETQIVNLEKIMLENDIKPYDLLGDDEIKRIERPFKLVRKGPESEKDPRFYDHDMKEMDIRYEKNIPR